MAELKGVKQILELASQKLVEAAAAEIVDDLKDKGPYYTGHFEESWEVAPGAVNIPATSQHPLTNTQRWQGWKTNQFPESRRRTPVRIPEGESTLTIGNRASYRDYAMDLLPGRVEPGKNNTAPKDWFVTYVQGGGLDQAIKRGARQAKKTRM